MKEQRLSPEWLGSTLLADVGANVMTSAIAPLRAGWNCFGRALTVCVPAGDNLALHMALAMAQPGDILVVSGEGYLGRALMGGIMCAQAHKSGVAGVVIDGVVRDAAELRAAELPVFALGTSPAGPFKRGNGSVLRSVQCGGVIVQPGSWIFADDDGVVVFEEPDRERLLHAARAKYDKEQARMAAIARGELRPDWLDEALNGASLDIGTRNW